MIRLLQSYACSGSNSLSAVGQVTTGAGTQGRRVKQEVEPGQDESGDVHPQAGSWQHGWLLLLPRSHLHVDQGQDLACEGQAVALKDVHMLSGFRTRSMMNLAVACRCLVRSAIVNWFCRATPSSQSCKHAHRFSLCCSVLHVRVGQGTMVHACTRFGALIDEAFSRFTCTKVP